MPTIEVSDRMFRRLQSFKRVVDEMMGRELSFQQYVGLVIDNGLDSMLRAILPANLQVMQLVFEKLFEESPDLISKFLAESVKRGERVIEALKKEREDLKRRYKERLRYLG
jgi:hypothetical protein